MAYRSARQKIHNVNHPPSPPLRPLRLVHQLLQVLYQTQVPNGASSIHAQCAHPEIEKA